jgi:hypothetical protein
MWQPCQVRNLEWLALPDLLCIIAHGMADRLPFLSPADAQMRMMLSALEYGLHAPDVEVVQESLEALSALAKAHYTAVASGLGGISSPQGERE